MKRLGQHFLKNPEALQEIITALELTGGDVVVEIGPGHGELTFPLAEKISECGGEIVAIEKDQELAENLQSAIGGAAIKKDIIKILHGDVLEFLKSAPKSIIPDARPYKLTGNIPYYITGHLLRTISELPNKPERCVIMTQKEVAERIIAKPPKMNRLAASVQFWAEPEIVGFVPKSDFSPPPEVDSTLISLKTKKGISTTDTQRYYTAVRNIFAQPRKTILNNLSDAGTKERIVSALKTIGIDPKLRPQNLSLGDITAIGEALF